MNDMSRRFRPVFVRMAGSIGGDELIGPTRWRAIGIMAFQGFALILPLIAKDRPEGIWKFRPAGCQPLK